MKPSLLLACLLALGANLFLGTMILRADSHTNLDDRDPYGGWTGLKFEATGFFRLEKTDERWWLVSPEGNAFLIHGLDHAGSHILFKSYNKVYWQEQLGLTEDSPGEERLEAFYAKKLAKDKAYLGFNTLYSHSLPVGKNFSPYISRVLTMKNEYWRMPQSDFGPKNFQDVFSEDFRERCEANARNFVKQGRHEDPWLVGHALTDSPILVPFEARPSHPSFYTISLPGSTTWPVRLRNLGPEAAGKRAYVALMRDRYNESIQRFNDCYNTEFRSWDELTAAKNWRLELEISGNIHEERDNHAFLLQIIDKAWGTQVQTIRKYDSNHLIFGDTLNLNSPLTDDIIEVYIKHFPVIFYQYYGATVEDHIAVLDRLRRVAPGVPVFSADSSWSVPQPPHMPDTLGPQCASYEIAGQRLTEVYRACFSRPEFLGWGWCGWMDQWARSEPHRQHGGLQDAFGHWHKPLSDAFSQFGKEIYTVAQP